MTRNQLLEFFFNMATKKDITEFVVYGDRYQVKTDKNYGVVFKPMYSNKCLQVGNRTLEQLQKVYKAVMQAKGKEVA